ncbi:MAG: phosphoglucomutase/phosphomannomutase family protein [Acidobacteria bacterium]|nr:phosphoglucomutase/phosphomannomutase family protein [Acidobacteriota bacterium]MCG2815731.1 phosphoglucomutase/phosphomannomutase family protein [Candidatus Aminicenantes bacterium]MBU4203924.1 phosphoglucomutase/phosphomannomutase family protein [Acidobacteriota bacterium]MBU4253645.1 phosphoglucomutase/phosphomannomutase family protein [Acidobacteriota bacterium]MBU4329718.1 phosphoglucomutase/phosphomannomutase family protein [Acidobacteriota bacterium]
MIKFGTNGWRAVMGEEFTFQNVRTVTQAIANYFNERFSREDISIVMNYDTRFLSERFAMESAKVLSHNRIHVLFSDRDGPSQAQAYQVIKRNAQGGINFTASFNPPEYNGLKFSMESGAPAMPAETDKIEEEVRRLSSQGYSFCPYYPKNDYIKRIGLQEDYLSYIEPKIDFAAIRKSGIRVAVDLLYSTSREYLDEILEENGVPIEEIHGYIDPYFGGIAPSCTEANLAELKTFVREKKCNVGIATDADGDRFGVVDENGDFISQNLILSLLLDYVVKEKGWRGGVARSVATTHLLDRIARKFELPLHKTRVGFKYIADLFLRENMIFGGEESASLAIKDHLPEKDGIMAGLLLVEMLSVYGNSLSRQIEEMFREYGRRVCRQRSLPMTPARDKKLRKLIKNPPSKLGGRRVINIETIEGIKLDFENDDWLLLRFSGTEPIIRWYAEAGDKAELGRLIKNGLELVA